jgi:hypothetical protein
VDIPTARLGTQLTDPSAENLAERPARSPAGRLVVLLPATGQVPLQYQLFLQQAAAAGDYVIGLAYPDDTTVAQRCHDVASCFGTARRNLFDGGASTAASHFSAPDSITGRLVSLLRLLVRSDPSGHWEQFLMGDGPKWGQILVAGHSQGGGEADYIAHSVRVLGALMFSSPEDSSGLFALRPAPWLTASSATPMSHVFGFVDERDTFIRSITVDWAALGLGAMHSVDGTVAPFGHAHALTTTSTDAGAGLRAHSATIMDAYTPRCGDGRIKYAKVWSYMLAAAAGLTAPPVATC